MVQRSIYNLRNGRYGRYGCPLSALHLVDQACTKALLTLEFKSTTTSETAVELLLFEDHLTVPSSVTPVDRKYTPHTCQHAFAIDIHPPLPPRSCIRTYCHKLSGMER